MKENTIKKSDIKNDEKRPTVLGLVAYIIVIVLLAVMAIFARQLASSIKGPILCIYIAVLPKYIFGLALILAGIDGIVYGIRFFRKEKWISLTAAGIQLVALVIFLFLIFPLAVREGVPAGQTYNIMRLLIGVMILVIAWDFISQTRQYLKGRK